MQLSLASSKCKRFVIPWARDRIGREALHLNSNGFFNFFGRVNFILEQVKINIFIFIFIFCLEKALALVFSKFVEIKRFISNFYHKIMVVRAVYGTMSKFFFRGIQWNHLSQEAEAENLIKKSWKPSLTRGRESNKEKLEG